MIPKPRIGAVFYYVNDIDRTEAFYRKAIGLDVKRMPDDGNGQPWLSASTAGNVDLLFFKGEARPGSSPIVVFDLADGGIDDVVSALASAGASIVTPVSHAPGGWTADFHDPDRYTLSLYQSNEKPRGRS